MTYRGRLAPSPTGYLHFGHARTFWVAQERAQSSQGILVLRNEDLDIGRARPEFAQAAIEDLRWFGFHWQEGYDIGGPFAPYSQSERMEFYRAAFHLLRQNRSIYPCTCSRQDVARSLGAPHQGDEEPVYPGTCRSKEWADQLRHPRVNWRFHVPDNRAIAFTDGYFASQSFTAGRDFGDFVVWRHDGIPSYQLAVVVDDAAMEITEVVRGEDLLLSTARQILIYKALGLSPPQFYHCPLVRDDAGQRLSKRHNALSLRALREKGQTPEDIRAAWGREANRILL